MSQAHPEADVQRLCRLAGISRASFYRHREERDPEGLSGILCAGPVDIYWPMNRSPNITANWVRASNHSRGVFFQSPP
jgi:hypothetical protein